MIKHDVILAVKELLERNWDVDAIASKLWMATDTVQSIVDMIQGTLL
jgi:hypothetical protein